MHLRFIKLFNRPNVNWKIESVLVYYKDKQFFFERKNFSRKQKCHKISILTELDLLKKEIQKLKLVPTYHDSELNSIVERLKQEINEFSSDFTLVTQLVYKYN